MRDIAIISFAQTPARRSVPELNEVEMLMPAIHRALSQVDMTIDDIGFTCSGSTDYLAGSAFSFVSTLDGVGPWPPIQEIPADQVRIGMRVEAVWRDDADIEPTLESIKWFRPTGEPDDVNVRIPGEKRGTGLGSWPGGVPPTELVVRNPRTGLGGTEGSAA